MHAVFCPRPDELPHRVNTWSAAAAIVATGAVVVAVTDADACVVVIHHQCCATQPVEIKVVLVRFLLLLL